MVILEKMMVLFGIMMLGFCAYKKGMSTEETSKRLSGLIVNIANPCIILSAVIDGDISAVSKSDVLLTMATAWIVYFVLIIIAELVVIVLKVPKNQRGVYRVMTVFSNIGYKGFPIIMSIYGSNALIYASLLLIPFNWLFLS